MGLLIFVVFVVIVVFTFGALSANREKQKQKAEYIESLKTEYDKYLKELHKTDKDYHHTLEIWKEFHEKYKTLGEPSYTVGYSNYKGWPWEQPRVHVPYETIEAESNWDTKVNYVRNGSIDFRLEHSLPAIGQCATFWKDARLAVIGREELHPEEIRSVKSTKNTPLKWIAVIIFTTMIDKPTITLYFEPDDRQTADELKAAINAFKVLP